MKILILSFFVLVSCSEVDKSELMEIQKCIAELESELSIYCERNICSYTSPIYYYATYNCAGDFKTSLYFDKANSSVTVDLNFLKLSNLIELKKQTAKRVKK